jgi:hypothetical protein
MNLLDLFNPYPCTGFVCVYFEVGIGYYESGSPNSLGLNSLMTQDFGATSTGPFLLGVVYNDLNHNNFYDIGEGIAGVTITTSSGGYYAVSSTSGGYAIPTGTSGTVTLTASGPSFGPVSKTVTLNGANLKVDFTSSTQTGTSTTSVTSSTQSSTTTSSSVTTVSGNSFPYIIITPTAAPPGTTVYVAGSGFYSGDTSCILSGMPASSSSCTVFQGELAASFVVSDQGPGTYTITATGTPLGDSASGTFSVNGVTSQTTTSTSVTTTSTQTTRSTAASPSISLIPLTAPLGTSIGVTGLGFSQADTSCTLSGNAVATSTCSISAGTLTASFLVADVGAGSYIVAATGSPAGDSASAILSVTSITSQTNTGTTLTSSTTQSVTTVTLNTITSSTSQETSTISNQTNTAATQTNSTNLPQLAPDFLLSTSNDQISLPQSSTGNLMVSVQSVGSFDQQVNLDVSGLPEGVQVSFSPDPVSPSTGRAVSSTVTFIVNRAVPSGSYVFNIIATSGSVSKQIPLTLHVSGCLIATATFGSELAPEVQFLRDFRDYRILRTFAGLNFMVAFNAWYYSFSPTVAQYESANPTVRLAVRVMIYPLVWVLQTGSFVFDLSSFNSEFAAVISGLTISALLGAMYLTGPILLIRRRFYKRSFWAMPTFERTCFLMFVGSLLVVIISEALKVGDLMIVGSSGAILLTMIESGMVMSRGVNRVIVRVR